MNEFITDDETLGEEPQSIEAPDTGMEVTIVHHNGSAVVSDFDAIEEINVEASTLRVWTDRYTNDYEDYHGATITKIE